MSEPTLARHLSEAGQRSFESSIADRVFSDPRQDVCVVWCTVEAILEVLTARPIFCGGNPCREGWIPIAEPGQGQESKQRHESKQPPLHRLTRAAWSRGARKNMGRPQTEPPQPKRNTRRRRPSRNC